MSPESLRVTIAPALAAEAINGLSAARLQVATLRSALVVARMAMEQGAGLEAHVAANGPTVGEAIEHALAMSKP